MDDFSVLAVTPTHDDWIPSDLPAANALVRKHGGEYLARTSSHQCFEGQGEDAALRIIIKWPSKEAGLAFENDPDYAPFLQARTQGSVSHHFLIEATDDLAS